MRKAKILGWCAAGILAAAAAAWGAQRLKSVAELSRDAEVVVRARVVSVSGQMVETEEGRFPFMIYEARVKETVAGSCPARIFVRVPGVVTGSGIGPLPDGPALGQGSEAVFFLKAGRGTAAGRGIYDLVSLGCGALPMAAAGKEPVVIVPRPAGAHGHGGRVKVKFKDFSAEVRAARENKKHEAEP